MNLAITLHDPEGVMTEQARRVAEKALKIFDVVVCAYTENTSRQLLDLLESVGYHLVRGGLCGEGRKEALACLFEIDPDGEVMILDGDKLLHILDKSFDGLAALTKPISCDVVMLGRTGTAWDTYPESWKRTESIGNLLMDKYFQTDGWDYFLGSIILKPKAATEVIKKSVNKHFDSYPEWIRLFKQAGCSFDYRTSDVFDWEDPDRNQADIAKLGREEWERVRFDGLAEWKKRIKNLYEIVEVLES